MEILKARKMEKSKRLGQVYTPKWVVDNILDLVGYTSGNIIGRYIFEPSFGNGAFLVEIVRRFINEYKSNNFNNSEVKASLEKYIFGIEIDEIEYDKCIYRLNSLVNELLLDNKEIVINWNLVNEDTLLIYKNLLNKFDFIVGNPPYIRIHNLNEEYRSFIKEEFKFVSGTIDIYLVFFELSIKCINSNGKIGFITPNSFLHNTSYKNFRKYLKVNKLIEVLIDFKHHKIFKGFSTYTSITILKNNNIKESFAYNELINDEIKLINEISFKKLNIDNFSFTSDKDELFLSSLKNKTRLIKDFYDVQYGFATLRDKIFISKVEEIDDNYVIFNKFKLEKKILLKIVKGSKYKGNLDSLEYIIFPYKLINGRYIAFNENELELEFPYTYKYLLYNKTELVKRDIDKSAKWFEFGRSQAVQSIHKEKIVLSTLVNGKIDFYKLDKDVAVYSGLFITKNNNDMGWEIIEQALSSEEFYKCIRITGKDFSGGYKSITSKQIKEFRF